MKFNETVERDNEDRFIEQFARRLFSNQHWSTEMGALCEVIVRLDSLKTEIRLLREEVGESKKR